MKILVFGSTFFTEIACRHLLITRKHELVGYVPNSRRITVPGNMPIPEVSPMSQCDIILSIQYDKIINDVDKSFNVHTGLLPQYGGVDILYHTLKNGETEQGITFHKITERLDFGPIISRISYPVFENDTVADLYKRMALILPSFVELALDILEMITLEGAAECHMIEPMIYKSGQILDEDQETYHGNKDKIIAVSDLIRKRYV